MWRALKAFVVAASVRRPDFAGIPAAAVYRAQQNAPEYRGTPVSVRLWADNGATALSTSWQGQRTRLLERWEVQALAATEGGLYAGEALDTAFGYTGQAGDDVTDVRDALLAALPPTVAGSIVAADTFAVQALTPGVPLALSVGPAELLAATRIRKTAEELRWCPGEITVQIEVVAERPRDNAPATPSAMAWLGCILGKFSHNLGPVLDLEAAGLALRRYAMAATDLTALDTTVVRSRARADLVISVDVSDTLEFDMVNGYLPATGEASV